jgi:hypothetical protein
MAWGQLRKKASEILISINSWALLCVSVIPGYMGGWALEDCGSRPAQAKKFIGPHLNGKKMDVVAPTCHPTDGKKHK